MQQEELCIECDEHAKWYCVQDDANFCDQHNAIIHSLKSHKSHRIVSIYEKDVTIKNEAAKPMNCKNHHMPLCLYCLSCKDVCCVACLSVDIHKQHSDQVKSVVDVANSEKQILNEHLEKIEKLKSEFTDEQRQLQQALKNIDISEAKSSQDIDKTFDQIIDCVQARRKLLKKQLQEKAKSYRDNIYLRQEDLKNITSSLNKNLGDGRRVLTLNDFAALSQSKAIIEKLKKLQTESLEYHHQTQLIDSVPFCISTQNIFTIINTFGNIGRPPAPSFDQQKCKASYASLDIEWKPILEFSLPITAYLLELGQNNNSFSEVYRGLATKYHLQGLKPETSYVLRLCACNRKQVGDAALFEMKTLNLDLNNWTLTMSSTYAPLNAENTRDSLLDGQFTTGAAALSSGSEWIQATFPYPVPVASVTIAPLHKNHNVWSPTNGSGRSLQYSHDNKNWTTIGTIAYVKNQQQKVEINNVTAQYWRLFHSPTVGTSSFLFK